MHKRQNVRASKARLPSSKETLWATLHNLPYSCRNLEWWHLMMLPEASHCIPHAQQAHFSPLTTKALPVGSPAHRGCNWEQCQEYVTTGEAGQWGSHTLLRQLWLRQAELSQGYDAIYNFSQAPFFIKNKNVSVKHNTTGSVQNKNMKT